MSRKFVRFDNVALVMGIDTAHVTYIEKYVLIFLAGYSKPDGSDIYPSIRDIEKQTGLSRTAVKECIKSLRQKDILFLSHQSPRGSKVPNSYSLNLLLIKKYQSSGSFNDQEGDLSWSPHDLDKKTDSRQTTSSWSPHDHDQGRQATSKKLVLNNKENVRNAREDLESFKIEKPKLEDEMSEVNNPLFDKLKSYNLTDKQIEEVLAIEHMNGGYVQSNISYFENHLKKIQLENRAAYLVSCLRGNWAKWGEGVLKDIHSKSTTVSYTPASTVVHINTPLSRKEVADRRFGRAREATEEQRIKWMKVAEYLDEFCLVQFDNMPGLTRDDFVTFTHPPERADGSATPFKSCVTRLMEAVERFESQAERERQKYINQKF